MAQTKIGDRTFVVNPLSGERTFLLQPKLAPALSEIAALYALFVQTVAGIMPKLGADADRDVDPLMLLPHALPALETAGPVIGRLAEKLGPNLRDIMRELLEGATCNGTLLYSAQGNPIDVLMQGRTIELWRLLIFAMEVSYPDFFGLFRGLRGTTSQKAESSAPSTTSPPGPVNV